MMLKKLKFSTKANNLENLIDISPKINILPIIVFSLQNWTLNKVGIASAVLKKFDDSKLIVRSSKQDEDLDGSTKAGAYLSLRNVENNVHELSHAVEKIINSYGEDAALGDQIFIQPMLEDVVCSGVLFTRDMSNGSPYRVINYSSVSTDAVTSGGKFLIKKYTQSRGLSKTSEVIFSELIEVSRILEEVFSSDKLDIEFGINASGKVYIFQVRPLTVPCNTSFNDDEVYKDLGRLDLRIDQWFKSHPYLFGERSVLGVMPDWNPAEIIGIRPRQLAMTLYKELVTDSIWAYQRSNYGYKNLRSFPLMLDILGLPYIDVRVSFNSFLPKGLSDHLGNKLINFYIEKLVRYPSLHDKVEFEIVLSCYTFDIDKKINDLRNSGFSNSECMELIANLKNLTNQIIKPQSVVDNDLRKIDILCERYDAIKNSQLTDEEKIYWYLEDCKRYGTLPFAGLARAAFISVQILSSLVSVGALSEEEREQFMRSIVTVGTQISNDMKSLNKQEFLTKYGHLRPGTYDINSKRYDEAADEYFKWDGVRLSEEAKTSDFVLNKDIRSRVEAVISLHGLNISAKDLFSFIKKSIEARENSKFLFTRNLSEALRLIGKVGDKYNFSRDDMSYMEVKTLYELHSSSLDIKSLLSDSINKGKLKYRTSNYICLPALIKSNSDIMEFHSEIFLPNFITRKKASGFVVEGLTKNSLFNKIVFIECADPGYDWIFTHEIKGFVTAYGGANSHMAIRANELGIPAVVGAGDQLFNQWIKYRYIEIDCENHLVKSLN